MFGFLKNLLGRPAVSPAENAGQSPARPAAAPSAPAHYHAAQPVPQPDAAAPAGVAVRPVGTTVEVSLQSILALLPLELQPRIAQARVGDAMLAVPLERVLPQLSRGSVKLAFGEVRQAFPNVFSHATDLDNTAVCLPLAEVLSRISPNLIRRRRAQRKVEVPEDIASPFDSSGRGITIGKPDTNPPFADTNGTRSGRMNTPATPAVAPSRFVLNSAPTLPPPAAAPMPSHTLSTPPRISIEPPSITQRVEAEETVRFKEAELITPINGASPASTSHAPGAQKPQEPPTSAAVVTIPLTALAEGWPEPVRKEIVQLNFVDQKVSFPAEVLDRALRAGRIAFTWRMLRGWMKGAPTGASPQDSTVLELPLKIVAPLFLAYRRRTAKPASKVEIDENIPNLFFGFPQPDSAPNGAAATAKAPDTNFYVWDDKSDAVREGVPSKNGPSVGTKFVSKYATPNEIVSRAAALDGVAGTLIALPDGLAVANQIPPEFNADTLAAFLPQIFGKVSQCTKELRMGDLNNLNFTVGNVPWKIFRVNAIFFAAFGRAGEPLPTGGLAALAAELDHKPK